MTLSINHCTNVILNAGEKVFYSKTINSTYKHFAENVTFEFHFDKKKA